MIQEPNFWKVKYLVNMGKFDEYEQNTQTVDNLNELLYTVAKANIIQITPLFVTEYKHPVLKKSDVDDLYNEMYNNIEIEKWNKQLIRGNELVKNALKELTKLHKS